MLQTPNKPQILPSLKPKPYPQSASLLGAHAEGPYLHPSKKGAHNSSLFHPCTTSPSATYGSSNLTSSIKLITIAPELPNSSTLIKELVKQGITVSLGHSNATYDEGLQGLKAGAIALTHTLNAMTPLTSRAPGLAGLISGIGDDSPYFSLIPDGHHLHPSTLSLLHRSRPQKSILISDSIELLGLPDGTYPGHSQIPFLQTKVGTRAMIEGTETLIGGCISLQEGMRNLMSWTGCGLPEAVSTVSENVARMMGVDGEGGRGVLLEGRRADLCVLSEEGELLQTWVAGTKVWDKEDVVRKREDDGEARG